MSTIATMSAKAPLRADNEITVEFEHITPERAMLYLDRNENNRNVRRAAVEAYVRDLVAGEWMMTGEAIKFDWHGNLIDGQHRLAAIEQSGVSAGMLVVRGLNPNVQRVIDTNVRRTAGDALKLLGLDSNIYVTASPARIALAREAGALNNYGSIKYTVTHAAIVDWVARHPENVDWVRYAYRLHSKIGIAPSPLAYCMYALGEIDAEGVELFFDSMASYATAGEGDPRLALLRSIQANAHLSTTRRPGTIIGIVFTAWNAWRDKQSLTVIPVVDPKGRPMRIPEPI